MPGEDQFIHALARLAQKTAIRNRRKRLRRSNTAAPIARAAVFSPSQRSGQRAEQQARRHLEAAGLTIVGQNLRCRAGEIDLVGLDRAVLVFIEVRHRHSVRYGGAAASVNLQKQQRLIKAANYFLPALSRRHFGGATPACRFDVVTLEPGAGLHWLRHAFAAA